MWIFALLGRRSVDLRELQDANSFFPLLSSEHFKLWSNKDWVVLSSKSLPEERCDSVLVLLLPGSFFLLFHASAAGRTRWLKGLLFPGSLFFHVPCGQWTPSLLYCLPPPFFLWPIPHVWKWTLCYGYEGEDEVCSEFPALLARQPSWLAATFCKSSLANQNSCWQSPDPEFQTKKCSCFLFLPDLFYPESGAEKNSSPTLDYESCALACMGMCSTLFDSTGENSVHVWLGCLQHGGICWLQVFPRELLWTICSAQLKGKASL